MAEFFSNQFAPAGTETASPETGYRIPKGEGGGGGNRVVARLTTDGTTAADVFRMIPNVRSDARIWSMQAQVASTPSAGDIDVGLHLSGFNHDGAVVDADLFEDGQSVTSGLSLADVFTGASLTNLDRGKALWELLGLSEDPGVLYDITVTTATGWTTASAVEFLLTAEFLEQGV
ncbi:MAG: hypothetical protein NXI30_04495 [bacterium]|nr:hypothetical protein [bacterium]